MHFGTANSKLMNLPRKKTSDINSSTVIIRVKFSLYDILHTVGVDV